jgi:hypothetical protein
MFKKYILALYSHSGSLTIARQVYAFHRYCRPNATQVFCTAIDKGCCASAVEDRTRDTGRDLAQEGDFDTCKMVRPSKYSNLTSLMSVVCMTRSREHISIYSVQSVPLFFQHFDGPFYPTLRLLHRCKQIFLGSDSVTHM